MLELSVVKISKDNGVAGHMHGFYIKCLLQLVRIRYTHVVLFSILISISGTHSLSEMIFRLFAGIPNKHHMWKWGMVKGSTPNNLHDGILIGQFSLCPPLEFLTSTYECMKITRKENGE